MMNRWVTAVSFLLFAACQRSDVKVLIGATTIVSPGEAPIKDSVVVTAGHSVRYVGVRKDAAIPQDSERINLAGKWITPADGGQIALGGPASLLVRDGSPLGAISRRLVNGEWQE